MPLYYQVYQGFGPIIIIIIIIVKPINTNISTSYNISPTFQYQSYQEGQNKQPAQELRMKHFHTRNISLEIFTKNIYAITVSQELHTKKEVANFVFFFLKKERIENRSALVQL